MAKQPHTALSSKENVLQALAQLDYMGKCVDLHPDTVFIVIPQLIPQLRLYLLLGCHILVHKYLVPFLLLYTPLYLCINGFYNLDPPISIV